MHRSGPMNTQAVDFHWLAFLLTDSHESSIEVVAEVLDLADDSNAYFSKWMLSWSRRLVIAKALTKVRDELAASARRTAAARSGRLTLPAPGDWSLDPGTSKAELQDALVATDIFPRAAVLLSMFEGMSVEDTAILLDADPDLVKKARNLALRELTVNLARAAEPAWRRNDSIRRTSGSKSTTPCYWLAHSIGLKP